MEQFTGVVTTGIYCRSDCSGRPLKRNTLTYSSTAAAEAAGFRPCLRCRPDRIPETAWIDAPELVCRAMRCIVDGLLDDGNEDALAERLGVSARHLRRLFDMHVGATPAQVARSRRAHFARRLLDETDLDIARIAEASGFNSVRQMNRVMRDVFRFTPTELRARRRKPDRCVADGGLEVRAPYRAPFDWHAILAFLAPRAIPGVEFVDTEAGLYRRTIEVMGEPGVLEAWNEPDRSALRLRLHLPDLDDLVHVVGRARRLFDLDADPDVVNAALARDPMLRPLVRARPGLRVPGAIDPFEIGVRAVLGQQVSVAAATRLAGRVVEAHGRPVPGLEALGLTHCFPDPAALADADLRAAGLTAQRARSVAAFANGLVEGSLVLRPGAGLDATVASLVALPGFGPWTAQYVAMRAVGERDAFPASDLALRRAFGEDAAERAQRWRPWRAYAAMHGWMGAFAQVRADIPA